MSEYTPLKKAGNHVAWVSQSAGVAKPKEGRVVVVVRPGDDAIRLLSLLVGAYPKSRRKFDYPTTNDPRYLVAVKRSDKLGALEDYYCIRAALVDKQMTTGMSPEIKKYILR